MNAFLAREPRWLGLDRIYKIYVTDVDLRGVLIGRQIYDEQSAYSQIIAPALVFGPLMKPWADRILKRVRQRETHYDSMALSSDAFLRAERLNFLIYRRDILDMQGDRKRRFWTGYSKIGGTLKLRMRDDSEREWIIIGDQFADIIAASLGFAGVNKAVR